MKGLLILAASSCISPDNSHYLHKYSKKETLNVSGQNRHEMPHFNEEKEEIKILIASNNNFKEINPKDLSNFPKLEAIDLGNNPINNLTLDTFRKAKHIKTLYLSIDQKFDCGDHKDCWSVTPGLNRIVHFTWEDESADESTTSQLVNLL